MAAGIVTRPAEWEAGGRWFALAAIVTAQFRMQ
jgi:hypothetical protein